VAAFHTKWPVTGDESVDPDPLVPSGAPIRFRLLGPIQVETDNGAMAPGRRQERYLLAILLLECGQLVTMRRLCELLWDGAAPERAHQAVRSIVSRLRALLARVGTDPRTALVSKRQGYVLTVAPQTVDAHLFRTLVDRAGHTVDLAERDQLLRGALALWRGPALHDALPEGPGQGLCADLEELRLHAIEESMATGLARGRDRELLPELARLCIAHPVRERFVELHMLALYRQGRVPEALAVYRQLRDRLVDEHGLDPSPALQRLHQAVLRGDPPPVEESSPVSGSPHRGPVPALLPADLPGFVGRAEQLDRLDTLSATNASAVVISAIAGTAGVGKTALAVRWAHRVRHRFPDGQLYVNLRGFDPNGAPAAPADVIRRFLDALGVPEHRIPTSPDAQADLYRSLLAERRVLIVLDNARDPDQVRPLLAGAPGCLTIVTSRDPLTGLIAVDGAHPLMLDLVTVDEARELLATRLGAERVAPECEAIDELIARCARLPLALAIAAAQAAVRPDLPLSKLVADLRDSRRRLDTLTGGDTATDLRAVFLSSYRALSPGAARLFRLIGLHPGPDIIASAAASLAGVQIVRVEPLLAELTHAQLLTEHTPGRYGCHDLLRAYATELAHNHDRGTDRDHAVYRILDHYLQTAYHGALLLAPNRDPIVLTEPEPGVTRQTLTGREEALNWFTSEQSALTAAVQHAADAGYHTHAWQLAWTLADFLQRRGQWHARTAVDRVALHAASQVGDRNAQAAAHRRIAIAHGGLCHHDEAQTHARHALDLYSELGDHLGLAQTYHGLSWLEVKQDRPADALRHAEQALDLYRITGDQTGQATALNNIGWDHALLGDHERTLVVCQQALALFQELDDRNGQALTWDSIGYAHHHLGDHTQAVTCYQHALDLFRDLGDRYQEAATLTNLGDAYHAVDDTVAAHDARQRARTVLDELDQAWSGARPREGR
jgi:DNA-binding SARP family transcriptional activator/tetratricopeptide (TPR) repeat protein